MGLRAPCTSTAFARSVSVAIGGAVVSGQLGYDLHEHGFELRYGCTRDGYVYLEAGPQRDIYSLYCQLVSEVGLGVRGWSHVLGCWSIGAELLTTRDCSRMIAMIQALGRHQSMGLYLFMRRAHLHSTTGEDADQNVLSTSGYVEPL